MGSARIPRDELASYSVGVRATAGAQSPLVLPRLLEGQLAGFRCERFLRCEMAVKGPVGQSRFRHDTGQADAIDTIFPKEARGGFEDGFVVFLGLLSRDAWHIGKSSMG